MTTRRPIIPPKRVEAEIFHRTMNSGRNRALLIGARGDDGILIDCVAKLPGLMENGMMHPLPSLLEWLASVLAKDLGIRTPDPYEFLVPAELAGSIADPTLRRGIERSVGSVFGSAFVRGSPMLAADLLDASLRPAAATLVAFDAYIHNVDRRASNPNLFLERNEPIAFDHGDAFTFIWPLLGGGDPALDPVPDLLGQHAFANLVRRRGAPDLSEFRAKLAALDDGRFDELASAAPATWQTGPAQGKLHRVLDILRRRRDAVEQWLPQVEAWMQS